MAEGLTKSISTVSLVIPLYNEEESLQSFYNSLSKVIASIKGYRFDILFIDDGSKDKSAKIVADICKTNPGARLISLSKNYGKEIALTAGIMHAKGDAILSLDSDGQHPVELIPNFLREWKDNHYDVVIGVRQKNQNEGFIKRYGSKAFYAVFNRISENTIVPRSTDFRLIDREVADEFIKIKNRNRITRGIIDSLGYRRTTIDFDAYERIGGVATYDNKKLIGLALNSFMSMSMAPLRALIKVGFFITLLASTLGIFIFFEDIVLNNILDLNITGSAYIACLILLLTGILLIGQGITSLYIADIYRTAADVPLYSISKKRSIRI